MKWTRSNTSLKTCAALIPDEFPGGFSSVFFDCQQIQAGRKIGSINLSGLREVRIYFLPDGVVNRNRSIGRIIDGDKIGEWVWIYRNILGIERAEIVIGKRKIESKSLCT